MQHLKTWLMEKTTWAGITALITAIGTWLSTGTLDGGEPSAKTLFISAGFLLVLKGRNPWQAMAGAAEPKKEGDSK